MTHKRHLWQVFLSFIIISLVIIASLVWYTIGQSKRLIKDIYFEELQTKAQIVARLIENDLKAQNYQQINHQLNKLFYDLSSFVTVILPDGKVIADTRKNPELLDNHADRPEIREAFSGHVGRNIRYSYSVSKTLVYLALPVFNNGQVIGVVRTSLPYATTEQQFSLLQYQVFLFLVFLTLLVLVIGYYLARRISAPLEEITQSVEQVANGDFSIRLRDFSSTEMHRLAHALNRMIHKLDNQIQTIEQQRNQQHAIFRSMNEGILAVDKNEHIIAVNRALTTMLGIEEKLIGRSLHEVIRNSQLLKIIERVLKEEIALEDEIVIREEPLRYLQVHGTCLKDEKNNIIGAMAVLNDVTRLKRLEEVRRDFVANVSHEIRTPLTSIKGFVETLLDGALTEKETAQRFLEIIYKQTNRLSSIIDDLMVLATLEQKEERSEFQFTEELLFPVIEQAVNVCQPAAAEKSIAIEVSCPDDLTLRMNPSLLEQALINLLTNAIKYSPENTTVKIEVSLEENQVVIKVIDQGIGIPKEFHERIFERFYRVDRARSREMGGTGLGLSIVKHIVKVHNGRVGVESKVGQGSTFFIYLPLEKSAQK